MANVCATFILGNLVFVFSDLTTLPHDATDNQLICTSKELSLLNNEINASYHPAGIQHCNNVRFWLYFGRESRITLSQRCNNVVFPTSLLQPKTSIVTTLCFPRRFSDLVLTLQKRRDSDVVFLTKI